MSNEPMTQQEQDALRDALAELEGDQPTQRRRFRALRRRDPVLDRACAFQKRGGA